MIEEAKAKALEFVETYEDLMASYDKEIRERSKRCAIACATEIRRNIDNCTPTDEPYANLMAVEYWDLVVEEIKKL